MMRWLLLLLLMLNVFYYVWGQQQVGGTFGDSAPPEGRSTQEGIRLLSESLGVARHDAVTQVREEVCLFLGSFEQAERADALQQRLFSLDIASQVESINTEGGVDYWVYLAPLASRQASLRQLKELQARKIDSYLISTGDLANGISLGIFPLMDSAESVMFRLRSGGYEPLLRELPRAHRAYWVRIAPQSRRIADDSVLERMAQDFKGLQHRLMPCKGIATGG